MQNATSCDGLAIYSGYSSQCVNGLGYDANQQNYFSVLYVESDDQRPACSLQSSTGSATLHTPKGCSQSKGTQNTLGPSDRLSPNSLYQNSCNGQNVKNAGHGSLTSVTRKQIFPWMTESRQNTKEQKSSITRSGDYNNKSNKSVDLHTHMAIQM